MPLSPALSVVFRSPGVSSIATSESSEASPSCSAGSQSARLNENEFDGTYSQTSECKMRATLPASCTVVYLLKPVQGGLFLSSGRLTRDEEVTPKTRKQGLLHNCPQYVRNPDRLWPRYSVRNIITGSIRVARATAGRAPGTRYSHWCLLTQAIIFLASNYDNQEPFGAVV